MKSLTSSSKPRKLSPLIFRRVVGDSMQPSLKPGQIVVGLPHKKPNPGQVIIVKHEGRELIKRLQKVNSNKLFITGDNKTQSSDSREFGWISGDSLLATVIWPINHRLYPHFIPTLSHEN
jgi:nickel-type superoxide dismutase maturation protease